MAARALQVVEEARDIIAKDSKYETAVIGEDVLLTLRPTEGQTVQPQSEGSSLQEAGDALTPSLSPVLLFPPFPVPFCPSLAPPSFLPSSRAIIRLSRLASTRMSLQEVTDTLTPPLHPPPLPFGTSSHACVSPCSVSF